MVNRPWKIYEKINDLKLFPASSGKKYIKIEHQIERSGSVANLATFPKKNKTFDYLISHYCNNSLLIDRGDNLIYITGLASEFVHHKVGKVSHIIWDLVDEEVRSILTSGVFRTRSEKVEVLYEHLELKEHPEIQSLNIKFTPILDTDGNTDITVITFSKKEKKESEVRKYNMSDFSAQIVQDLETQLLETKENLQHTQEEAETTNEELQSTNEELLAANEELQSTNEELHSVNEELYTVNAEHQKKIEQLITLEDDIDNIIHSSGVGTIFLDKDLIIRKITPAITESYKIVPHDIGRSIENFVFQFNVDNFLSYIKKVMKTGVIQSLDSVDRSGRPVLIKIVPYLASRNNKGIVLTFTDISDLKKVYEMAMNEKKHFESSLKEWGDFAYFAAHDLRTLLDRFKGDSENQTEALKGLEKVIDGLIEFSSLEKNALKIESVNLDEIFEELEEEYSNSGGKIVLSGDTNVKLNLDRKSITEALRKLLDNAIKFNNSKKKVVTINIKNFENEVQLSVEDNGAGISKDNFENIFKMFKVVHRDNKYNRGLGIGLPICKRIILLHGGSIYVESEENIGSIFYVVLPKF